MQKLLAVVEVDKEYRVICQAEGCGRHVFKRIHVVFDTGKVRVLGRQSYSNIYLDGSESVSSTSLYTGTESRKLTPEEIALLVENTESLIKQFEYELAIRLEQECLIRNEHEYQQNLEAERRKREQAAIDVFAQNVVLRDVKCHYCRRPMKARAKSMPAVGYKCDPCMTSNRSMPSSSSFGVTAAENARNNDLAARTDGGSVNDYRNIRG